MHDTAAVPLCRYPEKMAHSHHWENGRVTSGRVDLVWLQRAVGPIGTHAACPHLNGMITDTLREGVIVTNITSTYPIATRLILLLLTTILALASLGTYAQEGQRERRLYSKYA